MRTASTPRGLNQVLGSLFGLVYIAVGIAGFAITSGDDFAGMHGHKLLGVFMVNPLHNVVHIAVGAALFLAAMAGERVAAAVNGTVGAVYLLVGVVGLFVLDRSANILALNAPDNVLHLGSAVLLLVVASRARAGSATRVAA